MATTETEARWDAAAAPFTALVQAVADWDAPTPCDGWTAAYLLDHVVTAERDFAARQGREVPVFDGSRSPRHLQWIKHEAAMSALAGDPEFTQRAMDTAVGAMTVGEALLHFHVFDLIVHRWDLARSQDVDERFTDAEMDHVEAALESFGERAYTPGILGAAIPVADGAPRQERLLARLGRRA